MSSAPFKYHIENGTEMELEYACSTNGATVDFNGVILPSSSEIRRIHGINHSFTVLCSSPVLYCRLSVMHDRLMPPKTFTLFGNDINHVTAQCSAPFQEYCAPLTMILSGKHLEPF